MKNEDIDKLYKYLPFSAHSLSILINKKIWYALPSSFNDPFDCRLVEYGNHINTLMKCRSSKFDKANEGWTPTSDFASRIHNDVRNAYSKVTKKDKQFHHEIEEETAKLQELTYKFGILSLCSTAREILMWSHYAQHHTGFCIEFNRSDDNSLGIDAEPVNYSKLRTENDKEEDIFLRKYYGWKYEKEWRITQFPGGQLHPIPSEISSIIIGSKMEESHIETIRNIIKKYNSNETEHGQIELKYAVMDPEKYEINIQNQRGSGYPLIPKI